MFREDGSVLLAKACNPSSANGPGCNSIPGVRKSCLIRFCVAKNFISTPRKFTHPGAALGHHFRRPQDPSFQHKMGVWKIERSLSTSREGFSHGLNIIALTRASDVQKARPVTGSRRFRFVWPKNPVIKEASLTEARWGEIEATGIQSACWLHEAYKINQGRCDVSHIPISPAAGLANTTEPTSCDCSLGRFSRRVRIADATRPPGIACMSSSAWASVTRNAFARYSPQDGISPTLCTRVRPASC